MEDKNRLPIWEYRPYNPDERKRKYRFCISAGLSRDEAYKARDWDWPRIYKLVRQKKGVEMGVGV